MYVLMWMFVQSTVIAWSPQPFYGWRAFWWRLFGAQVGRRVKIRPSARVTYPWKVEIGDFSWIGDRAELYSLENITIGSNVCISQDSYICTGSHNFRSPNFEYNCKPIKIGDQVWIAAGVFVSPGVRICEGAVVGARSLVLSDLEGFYLYAGQPTRRVAPR